MRFFKLVIVAFAAWFFVQCAGPSLVEDDSDTGVQRAALCSADWSATWRQGSGANEWWVEYEIAGGSVASAYLEIPGVRSVALANRQGKWAASSSAKIPSGTQVVLHATTTGGAGAQTIKFGYLAQTAPASDPCAAGACDGAWAPTFQQGAGANEWWVEYAISTTTVRSVTWQVAGGQSVVLTAGAGKWRGKPTNAVPSGTSVTLTAESTSGQRAETVSFRYLVDTQPTKTPCGGTVPVCSGFRPTWQQGSGANSWWVEYVISGSVGKASLAIAGDETVALAPAGAKWTGKTTARIPSGTSVVLRAETTSGEAAESSPFRYLVDTAPVTKPCTGGGSTSGLDSRPSNTTCLAPARPPSPGAATLAPAYADIFAESAPNRVQAPMLMAQPSGNGARWTLAERDGRLVSFDARSSPTTRDLRQVLSTPQLAALTGKQVTLNDEAGFHGMVFDPSFASNGRLYIAFSTTCDGNVPLCDDPKNSRGDYYAFAEEIGYLTSPDGGASYTSYNRLLHIGRWSQMHHGGTVAFGKDGFLYISSGDGLDSGAPQFNSNLFGKVLRIDVHGTPAPGKPYAIPPSNPFANGMGGRPEIFAWGVRNPFRMSSDRTTGEIWLGDVGQDSYEEVDRVALGGNYGWPCREGAHQTAAFDDSSKCPVKTGFIDPIVEHAHGGAGRSVTGGVVYRGNAIAGFQGTYVYGDFIQKELRGLTLLNGAWTSTILNGSGPADGYVSFNEDVAGEVYAVSLYDNKIHKLVPGTGTAPSSFPQRLSETGCVLANDATRPTAGVIPYSVNAELWSDGAAKQRWLAVPNATRIGVRADGDFDFPIGSVLGKEFALGGKRVETRLFVRHTDGEWAGYSYEWNDAGTDANLLPSGKTKQVNGQTWSFPSRSECMLCHTSAAGRTLGLEIGQLNGAQLYPQTQRTANQLATLEDIGMFAAPVGDPTVLTAYPKPFEGPASEAKARAYLHANCAGCHRPSGGAARSTMDLRFATPLGSTNACNAPPILDDFGSTENRLIKPGSPGQSIVSLRMHTLDARRMPPLGRSVEHVAGTGLLDSWIGALAACP